MSQYSGWSNSVQRWRRRWWCGIHWNSVQSIRMSCRCWGIILVINDDPVPQWTNNERHGSDAGGRAANNFISKFMCTQSSPGLLRVNIIKSDEDGWMPVLVEGLWWNSLHANLILKLPITVKYFWRAAATGENLLRNYDMKNLSEWRPNDRGGRLCYGFVIVGLGRHAGLVRKWDTLLVAI